MTFYGDQGPFDDAIVGHSDYSGWWYATYTQYITGLTFCFRCQEQLSVGEDQPPFCWHCDNPVPTEWERQHEDALIMDVGLLYRPKPVAR